MVKSKKIGIVTITHGSNYGNRLQNYALQTYLTKLGFEVDTLYYIYKCNNLVFKNIWKSFAHYVIPYRTTVYHIKTVNFFFWNKKNIQWAHHFYCKDCSCEVLNEQYDMFIAGSDQIWNPNFETGLDPFMYLQFARPEQRVAYAASLGVSELTEKQSNIMFEYFKDWHAISTREDDGALLVQNAIGKKVPVLIDPTMLLTAKEWGRFTKRCRTPRKEKYIVTYFLGEKTEEYLDYVQKINMRLDCRVIDLVGESRMAGVSPSRFVALIKNSAWVITDSFHAVVFSLLFHKHFTLVNRIGTCNMSSRFKTLFSKLHIEKPIDKSILQFDDVDWNNVESRLEIERVLAHKYLIKSINVE